jgi:phage/plasmid-associated DNA primase
MNKNEQVEVKKGDYITQYANYDYYKPSQDKIDLTKGLVEEIQPDIDTRLCMISAMRSGMIGRLVEKLVMLNGGGGNGKGLIMNLYKMLLGGSYYYRGNMSTITEKIKGGASPEVANMNKKRCVLFSEPNDTEQLNLGNIKALTGDSCINARKCHSNVTVCILLMTMFLECNKKPTINGRIDQSAIRRFINLFFPITYTSDPKLYGKSDLYKKSNPEYKTSEWQEEHKLALFHYLLEFDYIDIYEPESIRKATYDYLIDNDEFSIFMDKYYEESEDSKDIITLKDIHALYRKNFMKQGSRAYRQMTRKKFVVMMQENLFWKKKYTLDFKERCILNGAEHRNVFSRLKRREDVADFE